MSDKVIASGKAGDYTFEISEDGFVTLSKEGEGKYGAMLGYFYSKVKKAGNSTNRVFTPALK